jgi:hypothetical protein
MSAVFDGIAKNEHQLREKNFELKINKIALDSISLIERDVRANNVRWMLNTIAKPVATSGHKKAAGECVRIF